MKASQRQPSNALPSISGSQGVSFFNETVAAADRNAQLLSKRHKLQIAALKRRANRNALFADWAPLIEKVFAPQSEALSTANRSNNLACPTIRRETLDA
jgi:hypothetical protein